MNLMEKYRARLKEATPAGDPTETTLDLVQLSSNPKAAESVTRHKTGEIENLEPCHICGEYAWWISKYGVLRCGVCHPPAIPTLVKKWIGDPETLTRLKTGKPAVILPWEECRRRKEKTA